MTIDVPRPVWGDHGAPGGWAEENRDFEGSVHSRVFIPSLVLRKERGVLLASLVLATLGDPLIPLVEAVHAPSKRSTL